MRLRGTWECPSFDLRGQKSSIGVIGNYVILATNAGYIAPYGSDTLWIIDVSDPDSPYTALTYTDTAFSATPALINWFVVKELSEDSGFIYAEFTGGGRQYFKVLQLDSGNPPSITTRGIIDSIGFDYQGARMGDWVIANGAFNCDNPDTPVKASITLIYEGYSRPPDCFGTGSPEDVECSENYRVTAYCVYDTAEDFAEATKIMNLSHPAADVETARVLGCWRGSYYNGNCGHSVAVNETLGVIALGTNYGVVFVSIEDIEDSLYNAVPLAKWEENPVSDLIWDDCKLYVSAWRVLIFDVSDVESGSFDTIGYYPISTSELAVKENYIYGFGGLGYLCSELAVKENYIYGFGGLGYLCILEMDTNSIQECKFECPQDDFDLFPNPINRSAKCKLPDVVKRAQVFDLTGKLVSNTENTSEITVPQTCGLYLLRIKTANGMEILKKIFVIE
jgi:hypothetical protein